jgi:hypothetical protein
MGVGSFISISLSFDTKFVSPESPLLLEIATKTPQEIIFKCNTFSNTIPMKNYEENE